jgi:hypothetical protein
MQLIESLNRTMKLALDDGMAASVEEAERLFRSFNVQFVVGKDVRRNHGLQAALVTLLNAAPRTFLGDITLTGDLDFCLSVGWWHGEQIRDVARHFGVACAASPHKRPTILIGDCLGVNIGHEFQLHLGLTARGFTLSPDGPSELPPSTCVAGGVAAAGAALNECFQFLYFRRLWAGQREIRFNLPGDRTLSESASKSIWLIGLGHVGQAFLWCTGLSIPDNHRSLRFRLQDFDEVTPSTLSTGLLAGLQDVGHPKVALGARELRKLGVECTVSTGRANPAQPPPIGADLCIVAVDSFGFRRQLDQLKRLRILEGGIGDGASGFTKVQIHTLPGRRPAADIWCGADPAATRQISISPPAYQNLLRESRDECGTTQLAGRSIATPFVGAFLGALMYCIAFGSSADCDSLAFDVNSL